MAKKMKRLISGLLIILLLGGGAYAYFVLYKPNLPPPPKKPMIVKLGEFITNLAGSTERRFIKIVIDVETESEETGKELISKGSQMRDQVLLVLRSKTVSELSGPEGMKSLANEIAERVNQILTTGKAISVYFVEFAIQ